MIQLDDARNLAIIKYKTEEEYKTNPHSPGTWIKEIEFKDREELLEILNTMKKEDLIPLFVLVKTGYEIEWENDKK